MNLLVLLGDSDDEVGVAGDAGAVAAQDAVAAGSTQQLAPGDVVVLIQPQGDVARTQHRLERVFSSTEDSDGLGGGDDATFVGIGPPVVVVVFLLLLLKKIVCLLLFFVVVFCGFFFFFLRPAKKDGYIRAVVRRSRRKVVMVMLTEVAVAVVVVMTIMI